MTVVVGLVGPDYSFMGADACSSNSDVRQPSATAKVREISYGIKIGSAGSWRVMDELFVWCEENQPQRIRDIVDGFKFKESAEILAIQYQRLYVIQGRHNYYEIEKDVDGTAYAAIGSGQGYALGSMHAKQNVRLALEAAAKFDPHVQKPFTII